MSSLRDTRVRAVLDRVHEAARGDAWRFASMLPTFAKGLIDRKPFWEILTPSLAKDVYMPVSREQGRFLYTTARALDARTVVEFGTSFGVSTLYLAAAVRDNGGGVVIGTELEPNKHAAAIANLKEAGLDEVVDVRLGDALQTLREVPEPLDLVLIDGWKELYLPVLHLLTPRLRPRAVVLADNIFTFRKSLKSYVEYVQSGDNGFESVTLSVSDGFEYSVYLG